jgi:hypothetical protein
LVLHFSDLSTILYVIDKKQPKHFYYLSYQLQGGPRKDLFFCNVVPGARAAVRFAGIRRARRRFWPGEDGGRVYGPQGLGLGGYLAHGGGRRAPESSGRTAGVPGAPSVVRRRGALGGLGMRAVWGRSELRWEGARGPWGPAGGSDTEVASAGARRRAPVRRARSRQNFARSAPVWPRFSPEI